MTTATPEVDSPPLKFLLRAKEVTKLYKGPPAIGPDDNPIDSDGSNKFLQSPDGSVVAVRSEKDIKIYKLDDGSLQATIEQSDVIHMAFSPLSTYLQTWRFFKKSATDSDAPPPQNLNLFDCKTGEKVYGWIQKAFFSQAWPNVKFSADELVSARMVTGEVRFFNKTSFETVIRRIKMPNVSHFEWGTTAPDYKLCVFAAEKKGSPGAARIIAYPDTAKALVNKSFFNAQTATVQWNEDCTFCLLGTATEVDKTGRSYYGDSGLFLLGVDGTSVNLKADMDTNGKIYEASWQPGTNRFLVVYGSMPAQTTLFDCKGEPVVHFPTDYRNTAMFSPNGHIVAIAGFGNLQGTLDFWDVKRARKMGTIEVPCSTVCAWSPCSNFLLTGTLSPRLRVDNGFKIWKINGTKLTEEAHDELYQVEWRTINPKRYPNRPPKRGDSAPAKLEKKEEAAPKPAVYRPKHLQGRTGPSLSLGRTAMTSNKATKVLTTSQLEAQMKRKQLPPGAVEAKSKSAIKNAKRKAKRKAEAAKEEGTATDDKKQESGKQEPAVATDPAKKLKNLQKKLRQINAIQAKADAGEQVNDAQKEKLKTADDIRAQIAELEKELAQ